MKTLILTIFALLNSNLLFSQLENMYAHRMITDFKGVVGNENVVLCYGNWGIITYSNDKGETWKQQNLGDKYNIKRMFKIDNVFYGLTEYSLLKSTNEGRTWQNKELIDTAEFIDFTFSEEYIYVLGKSSILQCDLSLNPITINLFELNPEWTFKEIVYHNNQLIINCINEWQEAMLYVVDLETHEELEVIPLFRDYCNGCRVLKDLKVINGEVYLLLDWNTSSYTNFQEIYNVEPVLTKFNNDKLEVVANFTHPSTYFIENDALYSIGFDIYNGYYFTPQLTKIDKATGESEKISNNIDFKHRLRHEKVTNYINITEMQKIENVLYAVGIGKMIFASYDNGVNWICKSYANFYFANNSMTAVNFKFLNKDNIIAFYIFNGIANLSTNAGITWLPFMSSDNPITGTSSGYYIDENKGVLFNYYALLQDSMYNTSIINVKERVWYNKFDSLIREYPNKHFSKNYFARPISKYAYNFDGELLLPYTVSPHNQNELPFTEILFLNKDFVVSDVISLDSVVLSTFNYYEGKIYSYGLKYFFDNNERKSNLNIYVSSDNGRTWLIYDSDVPAINIVFNGFSYKSYLHNGFIFNYYSDYTVTDTPKVIIYDIINKKHYLHDDFEKFSPSPFYSFKNDMYYFTRDKGIYKYLSFASDKLEKELIPYKKIMANFDSTLIGNYYREHEIIDFWTDNENAAIVLGEFVEGNQYRLNFAVLSEQPTTSVENQTESPTYLYTYPAYPNPARNQVRAMVYWDLRHDINAADIEVYDVMGVRVSGKENISIANATAYNGEIVWNCGSVPEGVYFIKITHGTSTKTVKVAVVR